jgi:hypothetical protein
VILIAGIIDGGYLALAEGIVERVVDLTDRDAEPRRRSPIDGDVGLQPLVLLITVDLCELRNGLQPRENFWCPFEQLIRVEVLQRILILGVGGAATDADILHRLQI